MPSGPAAFPKSLRLLRRAEFLKVQEGGQKVASGPLLALAAKNPKGGPTRLGITVSSKVGIAVLRVSIRRRLRDLYRKERHRLPEGLDLVLVARQSAATADYAEFARAFNDVARRLKGMFP